MARHPIRSRGSRNRREPQAPSGILPAQSRLPDLAFCLILLAAVVIVYSQTRHFEFVNYDDPAYVTENTQVQTGLTAAAVKYAFSAVVAGNWMPVTLLSHILVCGLFGLESGAHHLVNVLIHGITAVLLFICLRRAASRYWAAAFVAFVFAVHPLHVESVAWVAERKDVLFAFFWFLALYAYVRYAERESVGGYLMVGSLFSLGLMCKPMMVTFPLALFLFDFWPLRREKYPKIVLEKLPLVALSAVVSMVTHLAQGSSGAVQSAIPFALRVRGATVAYVEYLRMTFWPSGLAVFYPYRKFAVWQAVAAAVIVAGACVTFYALRRRRPYLWIGWLWYLGTLVPVIGLVQAGSQSMADRYTYLPLVGISIMLAWGAADLVAAKPVLTKPVGVLAVLTCGL